MGSSTQGTEKDQMKSKKKKLSEAQNELQEGQNELQEAPCWSVLGLELKFSPMLGAILGRCWEPRSLKNQ